MIVRVGTLSEVGKVKFADTDGVEAVDVFSVIFVGIIQTQCLKIFPHNITIFTR